MMDLTRTILLLRLYKARCHRQELTGHLLKAAGTPMIRPEPNSLERLTLLPGLPSVNSMSGIESPALTMTAADE